MDWNKGLGDISIVEIFNFNGCTKEEKKKKVSSILKQSKYASIDFCDNKETVTDRKSLRKKRVSFAATFQVNGNPKLMTPSPCNVLVSESLDPNDIVEDTTDYSLLSVALQWLSETRLFYISKRGLFYREMDTGNIYEIPGFNESNASKSGLPSKTDKGCTGGNLKSRSSIAETSVLLAENPMDPLTNENEFRFEPQHTSYGILDKSFFGTELENENDDDMEMTQLEENNCATVISTSIHSGKTATKKNACPLNVEDSFDDSPFKSGSQEYEHKESWSSLLDACARLETVLRRMCLAYSNRLEFKRSAIPLFEKKSRLPQFNIDDSNKENVLPISPKFQNLKFIDSPPKWANVPENSLNSLNMTDFAVPRSISNVKSLKNINEEKENVTKSQRKGLSLLIDAYQKDVHRKVTPTLKKNKVLKSAEGKSSEWNKMAVAMDLTLMPEGCSEDSSILEKDADFGSPQAVGKYADPSRKVMGETSSKTRFSICNMDMTCLADNPLGDSSLCVSPHSSQEKENIPTEFTIEISRNQRSKAINKTSLNNESRADVNAKTIQSIEFKKPFSMTQKDKYVAERSTVRRQPQGGQHQKDQTIPERVGQSYSSLFKIEDNKSNNLRGEKISKHQCKHEQGPCSEQVRAALREVEPGKDYLND